MCLGQGITNCVAVPSVSRVAAKVQKLGGAVCTPKTEVPGMGSFAVCKDAEGNVLALWESLQPNT
jgi:predicted enzyme related to lactoylglutathione lyase